MGIKNERVFTVKDVELKVRRPDLEEIREGNRIHTKAFKDALDSGAILSMKLDDVLKEQGLWDDSKELEIKTLQIELSELEVRLLKGGIKLSDAEKIAFDMIDKRDKIKEIFAVKLIYSSKTAESIADDARTDYLLSVCLVYNTKEAKPYFKDLADYLNNQNSPVSIQGYREFLYLMNDTDDNPEQTLTEYKFLKKYKRIDDKLRLINKDGHLVDRVGRLIDENGRFIDSTGKFVDLNGNPVDEHGNYNFVEAAFLDDDGNPLVG